MIQEQLKNSDIILESNLSRIWKFIEEDKVFGVISAFRLKYSKDENIKRHEVLKSAIRKMGYGYIELKGGFNEKGVSVEELSFFIPNITKKDLIQLGVEFGQYSVIYKDENEFIEIGTDDDAGIGETKRQFLSKGWDKNLNFDKDLIKDFFSSLAKGSHRDRKFIFNIKEAFLFRKERFSFNQVAYGRKKPGKDEKWLRIF